MLADYSTLYVHNIDDKNMRAIFFFFSQMSNFPRRTEGNTSSVAGACGPALPYVHKRGQK